LTHSRNKTGGEVQNAKLTQHQIGRGGKYNDVRGSGTLGEKKSIVIKRFKWRPSEGEARLGKFRSEVLKPGKGAALITARYILFFRSVRLSGRPLSKKD